METLFSFNVKPVTPKLNTDRHYFKCRDCLRTFVTEGRADAEICHCGGKVVYMGKVFAENKYGHTEEKCACDERCTHARGPSCSCSCGAVNHGTGAVVQIDVIDGKVRVTTPCLPKEIAIATEWRNALENAISAMEKVYSDDMAKMRLGIHIPHHRWIGVRDTREMLSKAKMAKTHKGRMEILSKLVAQLPE